MAKNRKYFKKSINTAEEAQKFLIRMYLTGDFFHPEDSPYLIVVDKDGKDVPLFSQDECLDLVNRLDEIWTVMHDPCEFMLDYMNKLSEQNK